MIVHAIILDSVTKYQCNCGCHKGKLYFHDPFPTCCYYKNEHEKNLYKTLESVADCHVVDVVSYDMFDVEPYLKSRQDIYITFLVPHASREIQINELVKGNPSDYVLLIESGFIVDNIVKRLDLYKEKGGKLSMVRPSDGIRALIHSNTFNYLCGFSVKNEEDPQSQDQSIVDKINIMAKNHDQEYLIVPNIEEFYAKTNDGLVV